MRKVSKALAMLLALLMVVTAMPLSVFAEAAAEVAYEANGILVETRVDGFQLIVDGGNGIDDDNVDFTSAEDPDADDYMGTVPSGKDLPTPYDSQGKGLELDWDDVFPGVQNVDRKIMYTLSRQTGELIEVVVDGEETLVPEYDGKWSDTTIWDGQLINVLVVYPGVGESVMGDWLESNLNSGEGLAGKGLFDITTVPLESSSGKSFNNNTTDYIKEDGTSDYDVILFGTWDCNNGQDLTPASAGILRKFIENGDGGVVFGHDTICDAPAADHENFASFAGDIGIKVGKNSDFTNTSVATEKTERAKVVEREGVITNYPWVIAGKSDKHNIYKDNAVDKEITENNIIDIPTTHAMYQLTDPSSTAKVWIELADGDRETAAGIDENRAKNIQGNNDGVYGQKSKKGDISNAYLVTNNNVAMIQTGHRNGEATDDERKVFANVLFFLQQNLLDNYSVDHDFRDVADPKVNGTADEIQATVAMVEGSYDPAYGSYYPGGEYDGVQTFDATFTVSGSDIGSPYRYKVEAIDGRTQPEYEHKRTSNMLEAVATANLQGFVIEINEKSSMTLEEAKALVIERTDKENGYAVDLDVEAADGDEVTYTAENLDTRKVWYAHIIPVDNSNNAGAPVTVKIALEELMEDDNNVISDIVATPNVPIDEETGEPADTNNSYTDAQGDAVYYPSNYEDINGVEFPDGKKQEDSEVNIGITATVDTLDKNVVGVITLTKWAVDEKGNIKTDADGNPIVERFYTAEDLDELADITAALEFGEVYTKDITFDIDEIYLNDSDYGTNGEYTVNLDWYEVNPEDGSVSEEPIESESVDFTIVRPDYKVTFNYKEADENGELKECVETKIVKHGDDATAPSIDKAFKADGEHYFFKQWDNVYTDITSDTVVNAEYNKYPGGSAPTIPDEPEKPADPEIEFIRLGGETRIETAIEISKEGWDRSKIVILATANEFPDAMAGVPLAKAVDAPILLTVNGEKLEQSVKDEIARLNPQKVYILGQTVAVNAKIEKELQAMYDIERVGGKDRFGTAVQIAYELEEIYGEKADAVYFVRSDLFPDALSVSSVAAIEHNPILYVAPSGKLDVDTVKYSETIGTEATIIGGPNAVNTVGEDNVKALFEKVDRIYGVDRYATSVEVCTAKNALFTGKATALATGKKFPDALTGGAFAAKNNIPVLLVNGNVSPVLAQYLANRPIKTLYVFGGELAVSDQVAYEALGCCKYYAE